MTNLQVPLQLEGQDGNAFFLLGTFKKAAQRAGYSQEEIAEVLDDATSGDYDHLLETIIANTISPEDEE